MLFRSKLRVRVDGTLIAPVPAGEILADHDRNSSAVHAALDELLQEPPAPAGKE